MMLDFRYSEKLLQCSHPPGNVEVRRNRFVEELLLGLCRRLNAKSLSFLGVIPVRVLACRD